MLTVAASDQRSSWVSESLALAPLQRALLKRMPTTITDCRLRRRHRCLAGLVDQACRHAVGARPGRDATDAGAEPPARPHHGPGRRADEDGPRRRDRRDARRRRVRLRDGAARVDRLHHDAQVPPQHVPGRLSRRRIRSCARSSPASPSTSSTSSSSWPRKHARSWRSSASAPSTR